MRHNGNPFGLGRIYLHNSMILMLDAGDLTCQTKAGRVSIFHKKLDHFSLHGQLPGRNRGGAPHSGTPATENVSALNSR